MLVSNSGKSSKEAVTNTITMSAMPVVAGLAVGIALVVLFSAYKIPIRVDSAQVTMITLERTVCFGTCPAYSVVIFGNGTVTYEGFAFVAVTGTQTHQISKDKVEKLVKAFYEAEYFSLEDRYEEPVSDLPSTTTSITAAGLTKSVYRYGSGPEKLVELENKIDALSGVDRWVKTEAGVPVDFAIHYAYGYGGTFELDTASNSFTAARCDDPPRQHATLILSDQELQTIWQSVQENDFFSLPDFIEECPSLANCVGIMPENHSTLRITADGRTNEVEFRQNYELNHDEGEGSDFGKFKKVIAAIESVLSSHDLPQSGCYYL